MPKNKRKNSMPMEFFGTSELLKKIESAGGNVERAIETAVVESAKQPASDMKNYIVKHHLTGATERSWTETPIQWQNGRLTYSIGFNMKKGGIASLFLDVGTPKIQPSFFITNAVNHNLTTIRETQKKALNEIFKELI